MTTITIALPEDQLERLKTLAQRAGVSPEELAQLGLQEWLDQSREEFLQAARYVLAKNADLYRRLA
jgi:hypothetical protein